MPQCPSIADLEDFIRGRCDEALGRHLDACPACAERAAEIRLNNQLLHELSSLSKSASGVRTVGGAHPQIDGYEIIESTGRGTQGVVYKAIQKATKRIVAIKILGGGHFAGMRQRRRFEREVELAAALRHPNIVTVFDSGACADGRLFCVMEFVDGVSLDRHLAQRATALRHRPKIEELLGLFVKICDAAQHAHLHGVIHRDLKPANILVDTTVDATGEPRIVDFGLAKLADNDATLQATQTHAGEFAGTIAYASPEQTRGQPENIDTRTDVYSLGVILYEMLTGELPYSIAGSMSEILRSIAELPPVAPSQVRPEIGGDVETILLKALAKEAVRRYQTAGELAQDIHHYLADEPVDARRDSTWYVLSKAMKRHRAPVAAGSAFVVMLTVFAVVVSIAYRRAQISEGLASARSIDLAKQLSISNIERGRAMARAENTSQAEELLWHEYFAEQSAEQSTGRSAAVTSPARWALRELYMAQPCLATFAIAHARQLDLSDDARTLAIVPDASPVIEIWDVSTHQRTATLTADHPNLSYVILSRDGKWLLTACPNGFLQFFDVAAKSSVGVREMRETDLIGRAAFSPDGQMLATADSTGVIHLWDSAGFKERFTLRGHGKPICCLAFSIDGKLLASSSEDHTVRLWDTTTGACVATPITTTRFAIMALAFSPDRRTLATCSDDTGLSFWTLPDCKVHRDIPAELRVSGNVRRMRFNADGSKLVLTGMTTIPIVDVATGRIVRALAGHTQNVGHASFNDDAKQVVTASANDHSARIWSVSPAANSVALVGHQDTILSASYNADRSLLATGSSDQTIRIWSMNAPRDPIILRFNTLVQSVSFSSSGLLAAGFEDGTIRVWKDGVNSPPIAWPAHAASIYSASFSPDCTRLVSSGADHFVRLWDPTTQQCVRAFDCAPAYPTAVRFSPDSKRIACGIRGSHDVLVWDVQTGVLQQTLHGHNATVRSIAFFPDGQSLASGSDDQTIRLWNLSDGRCTAVLKGNTLAVKTIDISADGRLIVSAGDGAEIKVWGVEERRSLASWPCESASVLGLSLSPDAHTLTAWGVDHRVTIYDLAAADRCIEGNEAFQHVRQH